MPLTVINIVLPVVMESQLESTLDILCILESYAKLMQEDVGFAYHGGLLILAVHHNTFDLRRDAGVLLRPSLPFPSWGILLLSCWGSGGLGGGKGIGWPSLFPLNRLIDRRATPGTGRIFQHVRSVCQPLRRGLSLVIHYLPRRTGKRIP
uniref:Uncharacterized protein n=1 Tax=Raphanus sativus TaxID=3726 RepID=A0A650GC50_RAPSA|nr:hypothetical protein [Raphanus sativus]